MFKIFDKFILRCIHKWCNGVSYICKVNDGELWRIF